MPAAQRKTSLRLTTMVAIAALVTGVLPASVATAAPERDREVALPAPQREKSVPVRPADASRKTDSAPKRALVAAPSVAWPTGVDAEVDLGAATGLVKAAQSPLSVSRPGAATAGLAAPGKVRVRTVETRSPGTLAFRVDGGQAKPGVRVSVDYGQFRSAFGGDWASRLRLARLPECALSTPDKPECAPTEVASKNDAKAGTVAADGVADGRMYALLAGPSGGGGDFGASALAPSSTWKAGGSSGEFTWSYPMRVPPTLGGAAPDLALAYSSGSVDGRTSSTNNQPSWVGEGFDLPVGGHVERRYKACSDDLGGNNGQTKTGDLCWGAENAFVTLGGKASELIRNDADGVWKLKNDDGSRVEKTTTAGNGDNNGESWRITTVDGTQYHFGTRATSNSVWTVPVFGNNPGEDCYAAGSFATSWCQQAYRWNLDYTVDPNGNTTVYTYQTESNLYGRNLASAGATYHRGGWLDRIDYGTNTAVTTAQAPMRVQFTAADRCVTAGATCTSATPSNWPDVPWDQNCASGTCAGKVSPTFWTQKRLSKITTQVWGGAAYRDVDSWTLDHRYLDPGDTTSSALWLESIKHTGLVGGTATVPEVNFNEIPLSNRVDGIDTLPPLVRYRISSIANETGGQVAVQYSATECSRNGVMPASPDSNTKRCFPVYWTPDGQPQLLDWFHKYVVTSVTESDNTSGGRPVLTTYDYPGTPAWHYDDEDGLVPASRKTWSQWRGYGQVGAIVGDSTVTKTRSVTTYLRGMDDDKLANGTRRDIWVADGSGGTIEDKDLLAGSVRETVTYKSATDNTVVSATVVDPWISPAKATSVRPWGTTTANLVANTSVRTRTALAAGGWRNTRVDTTVDAATGQPLTVSDLGDTATTTDDLCTKTTYAANTTAGLLAYPSREEVLGVACTATAAYPADLVSDKRTYYDGATAHGTPPTKGNITKTEIAKSWGGSAPAYVVSDRATHDQYGRAVESWDAAGERSTMAFTPATGGPVTQTVVTNPLGHAITTGVEPAWGTPVSINDANSRRTDVRYDALGRLSKVWLPGRPTTSSASTEYEYVLQTGAANYVTTKSLRPDGTSYTYSYAFYDGLLRPRQSQAPSPGIAGGRVISEVYYDARGSAFKTNGPFFNSGPADITLATPVNDNDVPNQTVTEFDGVGRKTAEILREMGTEKWRTTTTYGGDRVHVDPPVGATPTTTITDARGKTTELRHYLGAGPTGTYQSTSYTYTHASELATVTDPAGNLWRNTYDLRGLRTKEEDPAKGTTNYAFDDAARLSTSTDARNVTLAYEYDKLSRKTGVYEGSLTGTKRAAWTYDTAVNGIGMAASSTRYDNQNAYTTTVNGYDAGGRSTGTTITIPAAEGALAGSYSTTAAYRPNGSLESLAHPAAGGLPSETVAIGYNALGLPDTLTGASSYVKQTTYTDVGELGQLITSTAATGKKVTQTFYYERGTRRLSQLRLDRQATGLNQGNLYFSYDEAGNVTRIADLPIGLPSDIQCFRQDSQQRVTEAWTPAADNCATNPTVAALGGPAPYWQSYSYDAIGKRTGETQHASGGDTTRTYTYPAAGQPRTTSLSQVSTAKTGQPTTTDTFTYNNTGDTLTRNVAGQPGHTLTWDAEGSLASDTAGGQTTTFLYTAEGERLLRRDPTHTTLYLGDTELRCNRAAGTVTGTRYYTFADRVIGARTAAGVTWFSADHHGTSHFAVDAVTLDVQRKRYLPFGGSRGTAPTAWPGERSFVNGTTDASTGLVHLGAREYDAATGRFISVDPVLDVTDPQQMNGYAYANGNPVTLSDPGGEFSDCGCASDRYGYDNVLYQADGTRPISAGAAAALKPAQRGRWQAAVDRWTQRSLIPKPKPRPWAKDMERVKADVAKRVADGKTYDELLDYDNGAPSHIQEAMREELHAELCKSYQANCVDIGVEIASTTVFVAAPIGVSEKKFESADIVRSATEKVLTENTMESLIDENLSPKEAQALRSKPWLTRAFAGTAVHRATSKMLDRMFPNRFTYSASRGPDFFDKQTNSHVELTTRGQVTAHYNRGGAYKDTAYVAYNLGAMASQR
ncbi:RHS repeat-associated core domain-containing protein [Actinokineospora globicatena]|uniref:RHS repeat-associated core domain-containing protein n=1 Tax=Actinokineospora globicatena TaxID=103729 RepID=UPI0020A43AA9|nr:RHS repeat-associated core domain-containing protein [Actinokineospora globicatena]MCP2306119.1 RHS repeat-associated core domain-containing protein [Actinokineospora globicatena]GLW80006.1 type IV secretion protein Rhs [Actinokineospora globicatena]GLW86835.1 type IV secretion protein Rhs [Actinokineospora globicatena]